MLPLLLLGISCLCLSANPGLDLRSQKPKVSFPSVAGLPARQHRSSTASGVISNPRFRDTKHLGHVGSIHRNILPTLCLTVILGHLTFLYRSMRHVESLSELCLSSLPRSFPFMRPIEQPIPQMLISADGDRICKGRVNCGGCPEGVNEGSSICAPAWCEFTDASAFSMDGSSSRASSRSAAVWASRAPRKISCLS